MTQNPFGDWVPTGTESSGIEGVTGPPHPEFTGQPGTLPPPLGYNDPNIILPPWAFSIETAARRAALAVFFLRLDELLAGRLKDAQQRAQDEELNALQECAWLSKRLQQ